MASGTSDLTVVLNQEGDDSRSKVSDPSIQASLHRTPAAVSENIAPGDDVSAEMEPSIPIASSRNSEIIEAEADPSPGMEPSLQTTPMLDPAEDKQSSRTGSTSSPKMMVYPFMKYLSPDKYDKKELENHYDKLKKELDDGLQKNVDAFLEHDNITEAQEKVHELFYLFEAIEFMISNWKTLLTIAIVQKDTYQPDFKAKYLRIDIYYFLFLHALQYAKLQEYPSVGLTPLRTITLANLSEYFEATEFMVFLINKVQEEEEIMKLLHPQLDDQTRYEPGYEEPGYAEAFVAKCIHRYEKETISTFSWLVVNDKGKKAEDLFKSLFKHMKTSDIINRGRVYNYALQKVQDLHKVRTFLSSPGLSKRYKDVVQCNDRLNGLATDYDSQVKLQRFLVDLFLRDVALKQEIDWKFVQEHDYPYLIMCVWECHKSMEPANGVKQYNLTRSLQLTYVFTSSAAMTVPGGIDIMKCLLEAWPTLVNAPYKGVAALHAAAFEGNEEAIALLLEKEELDINVRTGRLLTADEVKKYQESGKISKGVMDFTGLPSPYAIVDKDRDELIRDHLSQQFIEGNSDGLLDATKKFKLSWQRIAISGKKWNKNRWNLRTYQTALHIATTQRDTKAVKLLCDAPEPHQKRLRCHVEDEEDHTQLDILYKGLDEVGEHFASREIERILLSKQDVQNGIDRLYRNRQVLVDAVNTILVGAALIAGVTFAGWLQPPLGYAQDYDLPVPYPAPPDTYDSYLPVRGNLGVKVFALFNSLSFFFAIATVIVGADAAYPSRTYQYIGHVVETMHLLLHRAITFLMVSLVCVLGAFGSAAIVVLPPSLFFRNDFVLSIIIGGGVCGYALWQLLSRHSERMRRLNAYIQNIIKFTDVF